MTQITVDTSIGERFSTLSGRSEIRDQEGRLLGYFVPPGDFLSETIELPSTIEELEAAEREGDGRPLAEILRELELRLHDREQRA